MTNREMLDAVIANAITDEVIEKAKEEKKKLDARNAKKIEKNAEKRAENKPLKDALFALLTSEPTPASVLAESVSASDNVVSTAKASAMLRQMVDDEADYTTVQVTDVKVPKKGKVKGYFVA